MTADPRPAKQPGFQLPGRGRRLLRIGGERKPSLSPVAGRQRQQMQGLGIDVAGAIEPPDIGMQIGDGKASLYQRFRIGEMPSNLGLAKARLLERGEGLVLIDFVHRQPRHVLGQRRFDGGGIVRGLHDHARQCVGLGRAFGIEPLHGGIAPLTGDDLEAVAAIAHQQRLDQAQSRDGCGKTADLLGAVAAHIEF